MCSFASLALRCLTLVVEEIVSVSRVWLEDLASQASRLDFPWLLDFSAPSVIQPHSVAAPSHCIVCKDIGQWQPLAVGVLDYMKEMAENYLGKVVKHAMVTVPAYFND